MQSIIDNVMRNAHFIKSGVHIRSKDVPDGIVKWVDALTKVEYLTEQTNGLGTSCKIYGKIDDIEGISTAEITEYKEHERLVIRSFGDFRMFMSASFYPKGPSTEVNVVIVVGLSERLASNKRKEVIQRSIESGFGCFEKIASTLA